MKDDFLQSLGHLALGTRLKRAGVAMQAITYQWLKHQGCDIPSAQLPILAALERLGPTSIGELARGLGIAQPGVSRMVEQLAAGGWVRNEPDSGDRRVRSVGLTEKGQAFVEEAARSLWPAIEDAVARLCAGLPGSFLQQLTTLEERLADGQLETQLLDSRASREPTE